MAAPNNVEEIIASESSSITGESSSVAGKLAGANSGNVDTTESWLIGATALIGLIKLDEQSNLPTQEFLVAAKRICDIFEIVFGEGRVSTRIRADVEGNVDALQAIYDSNPAIYPTLNLTPATGPDGTEGQIKLLWLQRGLFWLFKLVQELLAWPNKDIATIAWSSYEESLGKHHNWFVRKFVGVAVGVAPNRADLLVRMTDNF